ncbi:hypothetical protein L7F22_013938 [Adiantum nelumboides]|nr:hypothetical protein [Adiantum nelumboides]
MSASTFACGICLRDSPKEPVLTCCGHVFCWRCIYRWLAKKRACPLCNGYLSSSSDFTPIYSSSSGADDPAAAAPDPLAAGPSIKDDDDDEADLPVIPPRPSAHRRHNCDASGEIRRPAYNSEADDSTHQFHHHASGQQQTLMLQPVVMAIPAQMLQAPIPAHQLYYMRAAWPAPVLENQHLFTDANVHRASRTALPGRAFAVRQNPVSSAH